MLGAMLAVAPAATSKAIEKTERVTPVTMFQNGLPADAGLKFPQALNGVATNGISTKLSESADPLSADRKTAWKEHAPLVAADAPLSQPGLGEGETEAATLLERKIKELKLTEGERQDLSKVFNLLLRPEAKISTVDLMRGVNNVVLKFADEDDDYLKNNNGIAYLLRRGIEPVASLVLNAPAILRRLAEYRSEIGDEAKAVERTASYVETMVHHEELHLSNHAALRHIKEGRLNKLVDELLAYLLTSLDREAEKEAAPQDSKIPERIDINLENIRKIWNTATGDDAFDRMQGAMREWRQMESGVAKARKYDELIAQILGLVKEKNRMDQLLAQDMIIYGMTLDQAMSAHINPRVLLGPEFNTEPWREAAKLYPSLVTVADRASDARQIIHQLVKKVPGHAVVFTHERFGDADLKPFLEEMAHGGAAMVFSTDQDKMTSREIDETLNLLILLAMLGRDMIPRHMLTQTGGAMSAGSSGIVQIRAVAEAMRDHFSLLATQRAA